MPGSRGYNAREDIMKQNRIVLPLFAAVIAAACGDDIFGNDTVTGFGPVISETRPAGQFFAVSNATLADVQILQGTTERLRIRAQENLLEHVRTRVEGNVLRITTTPGVIINATQPIIIEIDLVELVRIESSGSGDISAPILDAFDLEVVSSGSGDIDLPDIIADTLIIVSSGSGEVFSSGEVIDQRIVMSGSGRIDTRELQSEAADVTMSGSGPVTIRVRDRLRAVLSGSGTLRYYGSPQVQQTVTGSGRVERAGG
jgi:hypothetical protein